MTFAIHSWTAADGDELRYGLLTASSNELPLKSPRRGLVFVPGLGGSVKNSLVFFNALLQHFSPIIVPDLRGFGLNEAKALPNPTQFVADLEGILTQVAPAYFAESPWTLGGISLGGCVVSHWLGSAGHTVGPDSAWLLAPAVQEHPKAFKLPYVAKTLWTMLTAPSSLVKLPYGLESLTQNPAVLASEQHQHHMETFRLPAQFLWQLRDFNRTSVKAMRAIACPVHVSIPLADRIICPNAMERAFLQLPYHQSHRRQSYKGLYHDVPLEIGMRDVVADVAAWCDSLDELQGENRKRHSLLNTPTSVV